MGHIETSLFCLYCSIIFAKYFCEEGKSFHYIEKGEQLLEHTEEQAK